VTNPVTTQQATILIVDDDPANLRLLTNYLVDVGFKVFPLKHGKYVFELFKRQHPDLILLDILMSEIDGFEICRRLKASPETRDIPVIFMSALFETMDKIKGFRLGAVDYITKPLQLEEVLARVQTHLTIQRLQRQLQEQNTFLARQKIRFERLAEATFEGIVIQDDACIIEVNEALLTLFGYQRDELLEQPFLDLIKPSERKAVAQYLLSEDAPPYQTSGLKKDGAVFFIEVQTKNMSYQESILKVTAIRDITWRRKMEQKTAQLERENLELRANIKERYRFGKLIGKSQAMQDIYERILTAAASDANVVIYGESGTGKELIAQTIHKHSVRHSHEFVTVNCGALPDSLFESEFFGYCKGAFTGADRNKPGYFDLAHRGTLFLDEVGELSVMEQVKLLRVIETGEYRPLGSNKSKSVDVRIIAATHRNVVELRRQELLRDDFFYRVHVITITTPPLRERKEDIPLLIDHFLEQHTSPYNRPILPGKIVEALYAYNWPGNVRELGNVLHRYLAGQSLEFDEAVSPVPPGFEGLGSGKEIQPLRGTLEAFEKRYILMALNEHRWHREHTAKALSLPIRTLHRKMKNFGLSQKK